MSILSVFHIEPAFHSFWRWTSSRWQSDDSTRLSEHPAEDTLLSYYALRAKDLPELLREAWALEALRPIESLINLLERRLDNVVFRMGFAKSIPEARSLIARRYILVNRYPPRSSRMSLWPGGVVHLANKSDKQLSLLYVRQRPLPSYLQYLNPSTTDRVMMLSLPNLSHSPFPLFSRSYRLRNELTPGGIHA